MPSSLRIKTPLPPAPLRCQIGMTEAQEDPQARFQPLAEVLPARQENRRGILVAATRDPPQVPRPVQTGKSHQGGINKPPTALATHRPDLTRATLIRAIMAEAGATDLVTLWEAGRAAAKTIEAAQVRLASPSGVAREAKPRAHGTIREVAMAGTLGMQGTVGWLGELYGLCAIVLDGPVGDSPGQTDSSS